MKRNQHLPVSGIQIFLPLGSFALFGCGLDPRESIQGYWENLEMNCNQFRNWQLQQGRKSWIFVVPNKIGEKDFRSKSRVGKAGGGWVGASGGVPGVAPPLNSLGHSLIH